MPKGQLQVRQRTAVILICLLTSSLGPIMFAELKFAGYTVKNQTFCKIKSFLSGQCSFWQFFSVFANQSDTSALPGPGLLGLGPFLSSVITGVRTGKGSELLGLPPMDEIYKQNETSPNFFTVLLGRSADPDNPVSSIRVSMEGMLTVHTVSWRIDNHGYPARLRRD